ncbi:MAG: energy transducer TonB [Methylococcaceae bacterium]|nr:MAG: energy transducer TonB [Methylococcaceae bacterium]
MDKKRWRRWIPLMISGLVGVLVILAIWKIKTSFDQSGRHKKSVQQIVMMQAPPPPPPPPPPPQEIKPPEPEKIEPIEQPETPPEAPPDAPPAGPLGLDAEGSGGGDGFGLVGNKGGKEIGSAAGSASVLAWYGGKVKQRILNQLSAHAELRKAAFAVVVKLWISSDGKISRVELMDSTGKADLDGELRSELARLSVEAPPPEAKMPVKLRIVARK